MERKNQYIKKLLATENEQLNRLHDIVAQALEEESVISHHLSEIDGKTKRTVGERISDSVASFGGSWKFILLFLAILTVWILANGFWLANHAFDPYPFILLNLILSCVAALQAPVIMMSQNRQEAKDRKRAENDYLINLKAELEIRNLHRKMDLSLVDQFKHMCDIQQKQLELLEAIRKQLQHPGNGKPA